MTLAERELGTTGLLVSTVGLGNWAIGGPRGEWGWGPQDDEASVRTILAAVEAGVTWVDTAAAYGLGHAEAVLGRALTALPEEDRPLVFTKCGLTWDGSTTRRVGRPDALRAELDLSAQRLGIDVLDLYQLHWPPEDGTDLRDAWATLLELREAGRIRFAGVSNVDAGQLAELEEIGHVDSVQPPLSMLHRGALTELVSQAREAGTGVLCYSPMQAGLLTGKYDRVAISALAGDDWRRSDPQFNDPLLARTLDLLSGLQAVAREVGVTLAELAIAWVLAQDGVTGAIVGARKPDQIRDWIGAGNVRLDAEVLQTIAQLIRDSAAGIGPIPAATS